ncbi:hypothetical protein QEN19_000684 [Hanseniaspora menglaensis]
MKDFNCFISKILNSSIFPRQKIPLIPVSDTILITGGSKGLGLKLVEKFLEKDFKVINLDVIKPPDNLSIYKNNHRLVFINFDLSDVNNFTNLPNYLSMHNISFGEIRVIINNAGLVSANNLDQTLPSLIEKTIRVNYESSVLLLLNLDLFINKATSTLIVNIASVLGLITPPSLSLYGASKKALIKFHLHLTEISKYDNHIDSLLIIPGQINTTMFNNVKTPNRILAPILKSDALAQKIFEKILERNNCFFGTVWQNNLFDKPASIFYAPFYIGVIPIFKTLPGWIIDALRRLSGMDQAMKNYLPIKSKKLESTKI